MKVILQGTGGNDIEVCYTKINIFNEWTVFPVDQEPQTELVAQLAQEFYNGTIYISLLNNLTKLDFEVFKNE